MIFESGDGVALTGPAMILTLKVAVTAVTAILLASLLALARGNRRLHGRLNLVFLVLTLGAVLGLELAVRFYDRRMFDYFDAPTRRALAVHLWFAVPSALLVPVMYWTGRRRGRVHKTLAVLFGVLWAGTFFTGVFTL